MKRPDVMQLLMSATGLLLSLVSPLTVAQPEELGDNWYRTEILIFARTDAEDLAAEQWEPLPQLEYPAAYRFLLDPALADRRATESEAFASAIDEFGIQSLVVPAPISELLDYARPDAIVQPLDIPVYDPNAPFEPNAPFDPNTPFDPNAPEDEASASSVDPSPDPNNPLTETTPGTDDEPLTQELLLEIPYRLQDRGQLEFTAQARTLRRRGHRVLFHGSWWAPIDARETSLPISLDRSADPDMDDWPAFQGSLLLYRSRYLHVDLNLWLNTLGEYLPEAWQINPPPQAAETISAQTLAGEPRNPWEPPAELLSMDSIAGPESPVVGEFEEGSASGEIAESGDNTVEKPAPEYTWRHAIKHTQSRRMRSGEIHYLDHPIIGVVVKITPASDELLPVRDDEDTELLFRERHQLPVEYLSLPLDEPGSD